MTAYTVLVTIGGQVMSAASSAAYVTGPPTVTSVSPTVGSASSPPVVTLTGTGYGSATADTTRVTMGYTGTGLTCTGVVWDSSTVIRCQPPALVVTSSYVFIVTAGGQAMSGASSVNFSTIAAPTVSSISPRVGAGGASVPVLTLTGSGYGASVVVSLKSRWVLLVLV